MISALLAVAGKVKMEMIRMVLVSIGAKHGGETITRTFMDMTQERLVLTT